MRLFVVVVVALIVLSAAVDGRGRRRNRKRFRGSPIQKDGRWNWESPNGWRKFLDRLMGRLGNRRYGFGLGSDEDNLFNFDFGWNQAHKQWWKGPNVCKTKTEEETNTTLSGVGTIARHFSYHSHVCDETESAYKCTTTSQVMETKKISTEVSECCHGYTRKENEYGCPRKLDLMNLVDTARKLGLTEFLRATDSVSLTEELRQGNFTVFAPENDAFKDVGAMLPDLSEIIPKDEPSVVMVSKPASNLVLTDMQNLLLGHLAVGQYKTSNLQDEQLVETGSPYKSKIRVNFYEGPQKLMTANCIRVTSADNKATNGVIHKVEELLQPVTGSIIDVISKSPEFGYLKTAFARASLVQTFRDDGQFTVFAPTDNAFKKMAPGMLDKLLKGDQECLEKVLKNHVLPNVICSAVIQGNAKSRNLLQRYLNLTRDDDNKVFVDNAQVVRKDIMTTNGVIHVIDDVLVPDEALRVTDIIDKQGATEVIDLLKKAKLIEDIEKLSNITFFVPSNEAFQQLPQATLQKVRSDPAYLRDIIMYHVVPERVSSTSLYNNYLLDTTNSDAKIRINEYSLFPYGDKWTQTAQCAPIKTQNIKSCNGMINIIDKVMLPPPGNVVDVLALDSRFTKFIELIKMSGLADSLQEDGPFTIFAPTNAAFKALGESTVEMLLENPEELQVVLRNHIAKDSLCCAGIFESGWYGSPRLRTLGSQVFRLDRQGDNVKIGSAKVTECDITGTNGVVHIVDRVLVEGERQHLLGRLLGRGRGGRRHGGRDRGYRRHRDWWDMFD